MAENMDDYLDYCIEKGSLYENDKENVLNMYNNLITYTYDEIFNKNQLIISDKKYNIHSKTANTSLVDNLDDHTVHKITSVSSDITTTTVSETIYKTYVVHTNNEFKQYIIINYILEIYFQQQYGSLLNNIDNTVLIVPEILKYGSVNKDNKIYLFFEMPYYKPSITHYIGNNDNVDIIYEYNRLLNNCRIMLQSLNLMDTISNENNIFHNSVFIQISLVETYINQLSNYNINDEGDQQLFYTDILENSTFNKSIDLFDLNIFIYNDQSCILIDFEKAFRLRNTTISTTIFDYKFDPNSPIIEFLRQFF